MISNGADPPGALTELASGVDALYLSGSATIRTDTLAAVGRFRELIAPYRLHLPIDIGGEQFRLAPHGWGRYRYCLDHPSGRFGLTESRHLPALRVQLRSRYLHAVGAVAAVDTTRSIGGRLCEDLTLSVSRVDLYADWQGWVPAPADRERFCGRPETSRTYQAGERLTGFDFGKRRTHTVVGRIYDKTVEIERTGSIWWRDIWGDTYRGDRPVWRVEFEFSRQALSAFDLTTPAEVFTAKADLWSYATERWLTHRIPTGDRSRYRWPISRAWQQIQHPSFAVLPAGVARLARSRRAGSIRLLLPALTGYIAAFGSLAGTDDIEDTLDALRQPLREYESISLVPFAERVQRRRLKVGDP